MKNGLSEAKLSDVATIVSSGVAKFTGEKKYIDTKSVFKNKIVDSKPVTYHKRPARANMEATEGCVLFAKMQNTFKALLIDSETASNNIFSTGFFVLKPKPDKLLSKYLYYWLNFDGTGALKNQLAHGGTQKAINNFDMANRFKIPLPNVSTQKKIIEKVGRIEHALSKLERQEDQRRYF